VSGAYPVLHVGSFGSADAKGPVGSARARGPWIRTFRGTPASVPDARRFVAELLVGCPARETLMMCVSELCANAIAHTASGDGGTFIVSVALVRDGVARVSVTDDGGSCVPSVGALDLAAEGGRGLALVAALTSRWGWAWAYPGRTVWAEACWPVAVAAPGRDRSRRRRFAVPPVPPVPPGDWTPSPAA
jgi:serine/threonine-protein kinase RsbW